MEKVRSPAVAGLFYPADPGQLRDQIQDLMAATGNTAGQLPPKALIAPHAGYVYSGPVAASAYAQLGEAAGSIHRVVILAPAHRMALSGLAYSNAARFRTPLGGIPVDQTGLLAASELPQVRLLDAAFEGEHSIEVQLPFLQQMLEDFCILPLLVGDASPEQIEQVLEILWGGPETLLVISSDLSHYLSYDQAKNMDRETTRAIEQLAPERLSYQHACGRIPVSGLLLAARHHQLRVKTLDLRNSGDTAGPRDRVVGYGAYAFS